MTTTNWTGAVRVSTADADAGIQNRLQMNETPERKKQGDTYS